MFALTAAVWLLMVLSRNVAVLFGAASISYFRDYWNEQPDDRIERPARAFNNLTQVPTRFCVIALLMITLRRVDGSQVLLAWIYVASRATYAVIYIYSITFPFASQFTRQAALRLR
jgi:hypothetical protein